MTTTTKKMTDAQKTFCQDVAQAMQIWDQTHPDVKFTEKQAERQKQLATDFKESDMGVESELIYYRGMNKLLKEVSGIGIKEPPGTGDPVADFERAMKILG